MHKISSCDVVAPYLSPLDAEERLSYLIGENILPRMVPESRSIPTLGLCFAVETMREAKP